MNARVVSGVLCAAAAVLLLNVASRPAYPAPLGTAFTYQGQLRQAGGPAGGTCEFQFDLFAAASGGSPLGTQTRSGVTVTDGLFTISDLDFGAAAFSGEDRWARRRQTATCACVSLGVEAGSAARMLAGRGRFEFPPLTWHGGGIAVPSV